MPHKNKEVKRAYDKAYREANIEKRRTWYEANNEARAAYQKAWYEAKKEKILAKQKARYEAYRETISVRRKLTPQEQKENSIAYRKAYNEANKKSMLAAGKAWRKNNRDICNANNSKHKARKLNLIPKHLKNCPIEKQRVFDIYKLCKLISKVTGVKHHVDHMWPLSKSGPHWSGNLQIITARDNLTKHSSVDLELKRNIKQSLKELENVFQ